MWRRREEVDTIDSLHSYLVHNPTPPLMEGRATTSKDTSVAVSCGTRSIHEHEVVVSIPEAQKNKLRVCRICWVSLDDDTSEEIVSPCTCKGSMEYVHVECLRRWQQQRWKQYGGRRARQMSRCDVCKGELKVDGVMQTGAGLHTMLLSLGHAQLMPIMSIPFRVYQHYIISLSLMVGLETAVNSALSSINAWRGIRVVGSTMSRAMHVSNALKVMTGISIINTVVCRKLDVGAVKRVVMQYPWLLATRATHVLSRWSKRMMSLLIVVRHALFSRRGGEPRWCMRWVHTVYSKRILVVYGFPSPSSSSFKGSFHLILCHCSLNVILFNPALPRIGMYSITCNVPYTCLDVCLCIHSFIYSFIHSLLLQNTIGE